MTCIYSLELFSFRIFNWKICTWQFFFSVLYERNFFQRISAFGYKHQQKWQKSFFNFLFCGKVCKFKLFQYPYINGSTSNLIKYSLAASNVAFASLEVIFEILSYTVPEPESKSDGFYLLFLNNLFFFKQELQVYS